MRTAFALLDFTQPHQLLVKILENQLGETGTVAFFSEVDGLPGRQTQEDSRVLWMMKAGVCSCWHALKITVWPLVSLHSPAVVDLLGTAVQHLDLPVSSSFQYSFTGDETCAGSVQFQFQPAHLLPQTSPQVRSILLRFSWNYLIMGIFFLFFFPTQKCK